jgi:hypothetical protein
MGAGNLSLGRSSGKSSTTFAFALLLSAVAFCSSNSALAQIKPGRQSKAVKPTQTASQTNAATPDQKPPSDEESTKPEDKPFKGMKYRLIGPFRGGRSLTAAGIPGDPTTYYFGATGGGVWKSTDGAMTWSPVFDKEGSGASPSPIPITTPSMSAPARPASAATSLTAMASTNLSTAARPGRTSACATPAPSARSLLIQTIRISLSSPPSVIPTAPTPSAEFSVPPTAARIGRRFFIKTKTPAVSTSPTTRTIPTFYSPLSGRLAALPGA